MYSISTKRRDDRSEINIREYSSWLEPILRDGKTAIERPAEPFISPLNISAMSDGLMMRMRARWHAR